MTIAKDCVFTIITATYNVEQSLPFTIKSVREQALTNIQWIVIDGASKDNTVALLKQNSDVISYWISEKDSGIYDAWNKALPHIKGDWVLFLGAGDEFANPDTLAQAYRILTASPIQNDLVFGNALLISPDRTIVGHKKRAWSEMKGQWVFFRPELPDHATVFHRASFVRLAQGFDTRFKIAGDTHILLKSLLQQEPYYIDLDVCKVMTAGVSNSVQNYWRMAIEVFLINHELGIKPPRMHSLITFTKLLSKIAIYSILPRRIALRGLDLCRQIQGLEKRWSV